LQKLNAGVSDFFHWHVILLTVNWAVLTQEWWRFNLRAPHWRLYWHDRDGAMLDVAGVPHPLRARRVYLIPADTAGRAATADGVGQFYCHFTVLGLPAFTMRDLFDPVTAVPGCPWIDETAAELAAAAATDAPFGPAEECRVNALIFAAMAQALMAASPERLARYAHTSAHLQPVLPALGYIEAHYTEPITLEQLAEQCNLTPVYFGRRFQHCTGMTPIRYLQETRVKMAMRHLAFTDHSIEAIAAATGFGTRAYFTRIFTRHAGTSPAAYRKALRT